MTSPAGYSYYIFETVRPIRIYRGFRKSRYNHEVYGYHIVFMHPFTLFPQGTYKKVHYMLDRQFPSSADHRRGHRASPTTLTPETTIKNNTAPPPRPRARSFCAEAESPEWRKNAGMHDWGSNKSEPPTREKKVKRAAKCGAPNSRSNREAGALALEPARQAPHAREEHACVRTLLRAAVQQGRKGSIHAKRTPV